MLPLNLIVIDDVSRFAMHLWRYLADTPGFGIGDASKYGNNCLFWKPCDPSEDGESSASTNSRYSQEVERIPESYDPSPLFTPDGKAAIWWVEARDGRWKSQLGKVFSKLRESNHPPQWMALVDVRGAAAERGGSSGQSRDPYRVSAVVDHLRTDYRGQLKALDGPEAKNDILLISSYRRFLYMNGSKKSLEPPKTIRVLSKSGAMFQKEIISRLHQLDREATTDQQEHTEAPGPAPDFFNFLITGAGFELPDDSPGTSLGIQATEKIVVQTLDRLGIKWVNEMAGGQRKFRFPVPERYTTSLHWLKDFEPLHKAAEDGDLDAYWNQLLQLELLGLSKEGDDRPAGKIDGLQRELELREAFRDALLRYDWGHLQQSLCAAHGNFDTWLTTNYTRFANRAIQLVNDPPKDWTRTTPSRATSEQFRHWRVISTSNEANRYLQELLHADSKGNGPALGGQGNADTEPSNRSYLFKLHGDIPHVTTMALAGHDKEVSSPLSVPIDSLHEVYLVAERHLEQETFGQKRNVLWHIIGHGLWDIPLKRLLQRVTQKSSSCFHIFVLVGIDIPVAESSIWMRLLRALPLAPTSKAWTICCIEASARDYMARLEKAPSLDTRAVSIPARKKAIETWIGNLGFEGRGKKGAVKWLGQKQFSFTKELPLFRIAWWKNPELPGPIPPAETVTGSGSKGVDRGSSESDSRLKPNIG